jgi:hypothetical protein
MNRIIISVMFCRAGTTDAFLGRGFGWAGLADDPNGSRLVPAPPPLCNARRGGGDTLRGALE